MATTHEAIRRLRRDRGMSQAELAQRTGISRQALGAIEAGIYQPSVSVALSLAQELRETVESLFGKSNEPKSNEISAAWPKREVLPKDGPLRRVALGRVGGRIVAVPQRTACLSLLPAAGKVERIAGRRAAVSTFHSGEEIDSTLLLAGCDPAVAILIEWMARAGAQVGVVALPCSSGKALASLAEGSVHAAGVHLRDPKSGDYNFAPVRRAIGRRRRMRLVNFARWEVGLVTSQGNPRGIRNFCDLTRPDVRIVNRDRGSGARQVLDEALAEAALNPEAIAGYRDEVGGHLEVAAAVHAGHADAGVTIRVAAEAYGLSFIPVREERYDLAIPETELERKPVMRMLEVLNSRRFACEVAQLCAYDTKRMGEELTGIDC
jgi:putative molybdopterin biosynthesis protein